jgi:hypothetical protein
VVSALIAVLGSSTMVGALTVQLYQLLLLFHHQPLSVLPPSPTPGLLLKPVRLILLLTLRSITNVVYVVMVL